MGIEQAVLEAMKGRVLIQGPRGDGSRQVWVKTHCRFGDTEILLAQLLRKKLGGWTVRQNHRWGVILTPPLAHEATCWLWLVSRR